MIHEVSRSYKGKFGFIKPFDNIGESHHPPILGEVFVCKIIESVFGLAARRTKAPSSANWSGPRR